MTEKGAHEMTDQTDTITRIPLDNLEPHPANRRIGGFDQEKLEQLAESIREIGVQQPIVVRRLRAVKNLGLPHILAIIRNMPDPDQEYCEWQTRTVGGKGPYWRTYDTGCGRVMWRNRDDLRYCSCGKPIKVVE